MKSVMEVCFQLSFASLTVALALSSYRAFKGPRLPNRVLGLNLMSTVLASYAILLACYNYQSLYIDLSVTVALIEFLATVAFARYIKYQSKEVANAS